MKHLRYLNYVYRHKWFVFWACCGLGIPLAGITHDWDKFLPDEWFPYVNVFGVPGGPRTEADKVAFKEAWKRHWGRNPHHWEWWNGAEMSDRYRREMVADWQGTGRAKGYPDTRAWYLANRGRITLGPATRQWVEDCLGVVVVQG